MHTRVKLLEGMQIKTILKLLGGIQSNYWEGYIIISPHHPGFRHPFLQYGTPQFLLRSTVRLFCNGTGTLRWYGTLQKLNWSTVRWYSTIQSARYVVRKFWTYRTVLPSLATGNQFWKKNEKVVLLIAAFLSWMLWIVRLFSVLRLSRILVFDNFRMANFTSAWIVMLGRGVFRVGAFGPCPPFGSPG